MSMCNNPSISILQRKQYRQNYNKKMDIPIKLQIQNNISKLHKELNYLTNLYIWCGVNDNEHKVNSLLENIKSQYAILDVFTEYFQKFKGVKTEITLYR